MGVPPGVPDLALFDKPESVKRRLVVPPVWAWWVLGFVLVVASFLVVFLVGSKPVAGPSSGESGEVPQSVSVAQVAAPGGLLVSGGSPGMVCVSPGVGVQCFGVGPWGDEKGSGVVPGLEETPIVAIGVGGKVVVAVSADLEVFAWGVNERGQLGTTPSEGIPDVAVPVGSVGAVPDEVVVAQQHTCLLVEGDVWCFGSNFGGQIRGVASEEGLPLTRIEGVEGATDLFTSGFDMWARVAQGYVGWGNNKFGQIDPDDSALTLGPVVVGGSDE